MHDPQPGGQGEYDRTAWMQTFFRHAMAVARRHLPLYSGKYSKKDFTLPQIAACLLLKYFMRTDFREAAKMIRLNPEMHPILGLNKPPNYATLCRYSARIPPAKMKLMSREMTEYIISRHSGAAALKSHPRRVPPLRSDKKDSTRKRACR